LWTRKDIKNNLLLFCLKMIFLVSNRLLWAGKSFYPSCTYSDSQNGNKISRPWYCGTKDRSEEHVGRYKVMTEAVIGPAPKPASRNSRQCLPLATDPTETPLTSPFNCHAINTLLFLHKQHCRTDDPTADLQAPA